MHAIQTIAFAIIVSIIAGPASADSHSKTKWFKGNTHTHSVWSDGNDFPEMITDWYRKSDYQFLVISDHNVLQTSTNRWRSVSSIVSRARTKAVMDRYVKRFGDEWVELRKIPEKPKPTKKPVKENKKETEARKDVKPEPKYEVRLKTLAEYRRQFEKPGEFLLMHGEEISDGYKRLPVHINAINLKELIPAQRGKSVREVMMRNLQAVYEQEKKTGQPILAHLNHPNFGWGVTAEDMAHVTLERFYEVYNGHPGIRHLGDKNHPTVERLWDIANTIRVAILNRPPLFGVATDDSHTYFEKQNNTPGRGWVMVRAKELSPNALIMAMRRGQFYASSGITLRSLDYNRKTGILRFEIEPDGDATFTTRFIGTPVTYDRKSEPIKDSEGRTLRITHRYSQDVGKTLAEVKGNVAEFKVTKDNFYVRATITSSKAHHNPSFKGQMKQAWVQPVGWELHLDPE